ncbi:MAG: hypothetical protein PVF65_09515 [Sphingomonadales bacterium]
MNLAIITISALVLILLVLLTWKKPRLSAVVIWALLATIFTCAVLLKVLPGNFADKALWITLFFPLLWALFQTWVYWETKAWRAVLSLVVLTISGALFVFFGGSVA